MVDLITKLAILCALAGAVGCGRPAASDSRKNPHLGGCLLTVEWYGVVTKPVHEAALGTADYDAELQQWVHIDPQYRKGATVSEMEARRLDELLSSKEFLDTRTTVQPGADRQQYVIEKRSGSGEHYYVIGWDQFTVTYLTRMKAILDRPAGDCLEPIILQLKPASSNEASKKADSSN